MYTESKSNPGAFLDVGVTVTVMLVNSTNLLYIEFIYYIVPAWHIEITIEINSISMY